MKNCKSFSDNCRIFFREKKKWYYLKLRIIKILNLHEGGSYHIETSPLFCTVKWTSSYVRETSIMKELNSIQFSIRFSLQKLMKLVSQFKGNWKRNWRNWMDIFLKIPNSKHIRFIRPNFVWKSTLTDLQEEFVSLMKSLELNQPAEETI